ncbi:MAG: hypothetical protein GEU82_02770 [Luteitalea sp.]|nr:hypothetical protein [Luteitalea sp.]
MLKAWRDGIGRVNRAPAILFGLWITTALVSVPLTLEIRGRIQDHLGASLEAGSAASDVNYDWLQEFMGQAGGLSRTVTPSVVGFAAVLDNLSALVDATPRPAVVAAAAALYVVLLTFFSGGIIDRYARDRAVRAHGFFTVCGVFFFRFLRLGVLAAAAYGFLFGSFHPWLFDDVYPRLTADVTSERTAFFTRLGLYLLFGLPLAVVNLLFDYAKVRAVVEDRRSMIGALAAAGSFVRRNLWSASALYALNAAAFVGVLAVYRLIAPGVGTAGLSMWLAFGVGQLYVVARLWVKAVFWSSETALFQSRLAHAGYVRSPERLWPESPAAEAIAR